MREDADRDGIRNARGSKRQRRRRTGTGPLQGGATSASRGGGSDPASEPAAAAKSATAFARAVAVFVSRAGTRLFLDGQPYRFTGLNIYNANSQNNCWYSLGAGSGLDSSLAAIGSGQEAFRAWFFQRLATTDGHRDWSAFDHTLAVAAARGQRSSSPSPTSGATARTRSGAPSTSPRLVRGRLSLDDRRWHDRDVPLLGRRGRRPLP